MRAEYLKAYIEALNGKGVSRHQSFATNGLIHLIGNHYAHSAEVERLYAIGETIENQIESLTHCTSWESENLLNPLIEIALEKVSEAYVQGFRDASENILGMTEILL